MIALIARGTGNRCTPPGHDGAGILMRGRLTEEGAMADRYDLVVIGAGLAGETAAAVATWFGH
jgi:hypothetical protein